MNNQKPKNIDEYKIWLKNEHEVEITERTKTHYESVAIQIKKNFEESDFWISLTENLREYNDEYLLKTGYQLFIPSGTVPKSSYDLNSNKITDSI